MDSPKKAETKKVVHGRPRKDSQNDSEDELQPPSPIDIATEPALSPDFDFPDAQELRKIETDTHNRLKAILEVAGVTGLSQIDARTFQDPEILRKLTNRLVYLILCSCVSSSLKPNVLRLMATMPRSPVLHVT